jgi:hypothetical protein
MHPQVNEGWLCGHHGNTDLLALAGYCVTAVNGRMSVTDLIPVRATTVSILHQMKWSAPPAPEYPVGLGFSPHPK